jgi:hypothetical protein
MQVQRDFVSQERARFAAKEAGKKAAARAYDKAMREAS